VTDVRLVCLRALPTDSDAIDPSGGDHEAGLIRGVRVAEVGPARGHGFSLDAEGLTTVASLIADTGAEGVKAHLTHGGFLDGDQFNAFLGRFKGGKFDGETVRADLHFDPTANMDPTPGLATNVLTRAKTDPTSFGASMVVRGKVKELDDETSVFRPNELLATDIVGEPAATTAILSEKQPPPEAPPMAKPEDKTITDEMTAQLAALQEQQKASAAELAELKAERETLLADKKAADEEAATAKLAAAQTAAVTAFDAELLGDKRVAPAERAYWLGAKRDEADEVPEHRPTCICGKAHCGEMFGAYLATQAAKHGGKVQGGNAPPIGHAGTDAIAEYHAELEKRTATHEAELGGSEHCMTAHQMAFGELKAEKPELYAAYHRAQRPEVN